MAQAKVGSSTDYTVRRRKQSQLEVTRFMGPIAHGILSGAEESLGKRAGENGFNSRRALRWEKSWLVRMEEPKLWSSPAARPGSDGPQRERLPNAALESACWLLGGVPPGAGRGEG